MTKQSEVAFEWYPYANKTPIRKLQKSALNGKRVFLRVNYDIVRDARIIDDRRIRATVMDIRHIMKQGARTIVIVSHNGVRENFFKDNKTSVGVASDGEGHPGYSLKPVAKRLTEVLRDKKILQKDREVTITDDCIGEEVKSIISKDGIFALDVDFLVLAALENAIDRNAYSVKAKVIVEGANGPVTPEGDRIVTRKGTFITPDISTNLGGVFVSYLEWVQNLKNERWDLEKINSLLEDNICMIFDDIIRISQERKIEMRTAASIMAIGRVAVAELSKEIVNIINGILINLGKKAKKDDSTKEELNTLQHYLIYLSNDLMKRIPLDYWTLVVLISNLERILHVSKILDENTIEIIKDIHAEAIRLFASFVKAKPDNDDLLMAMAALPEEAKKQL